MLPCGAERPNGEFSCFRVARKGQMEVFHASAWRRKTKWRIFHTSAWRGKTKKEDFHASARRRKTKKRILVLPRGAERPKRDFLCFCVARKDQKEKFHASARRGKAKKRF